MSRRRDNKSNTRFSLFPFLAVLICTMGSLIVLLILMVHQAQVHAKTAVVAGTRTSEDVHEQLQVREEHLAQVKKMREKVSGRMQSQTLYMGQLEEHIRRLQEELAKMQQDAQVLVSIEQKKQQDTEADRAEIERLRKLISDAEKELTNLREDTKNRKPSYAIIPFQGQNQTKRRPIYIECRDDGITIQPGGVKLSVDDFRPPLETGNPLALALRATRQYWKERESDSFTAGEPYPLIIVRPGGILAYYMVRDALAAWDSEFGYEFVRGKREMAWPRLDPKLVEIQYLAIVDARQRRAALEKAAPGKYKTGPLMVDGFKIVEEGGKLVMVGSPSEDDVALGGFGVASTRGHGGGINGRGGSPNSAAGMGGASGMGAAGEYYGSGTGGGSRGHGGGGIGSGTGTGVSSSDTGNGTSSEPYGTGTGHAGGNAPNGKPRYGDPGFSPDGNISGGNTPGGSGYPGGNNSAMAPGGRGGGAGGGYGTGSGTANGTNNGSSRPGHSGGTYQPGGRYAPNGYGQRGNPGGNGAAGQSGSQGSHNQANGASGGTAGTAGSNPGSNNSQGGAPGGTSGGSAGGASSGSPGGAAGGSSGGASGGSPGSSAGGSGTGAGGENSQGGCPSVSNPGQKSCPQDVRERETRPKLQPIANRHGEGWGIPQPKTAAIAITRPIRVTCHPDCLILLPDRGTKDAPVQITMQANKVQSVINFVYAVRRHAQGWGVAGSNAYWKPILNVSVAPGAEGAFHEMELLLQNSGIQVKRK